MTSSDDVDRMFLNVERSVATGRRPEESWEGGADLETLGTMGYIVDRFRGVERVEAVRRALLDWLKNDETFEVDTKDPTFRAVSRNVGSSVDFIVTGHTHLERAIALEERRSFYYNSGTWIRLLRFDEDLLGDPHEFARVFDVLRAGKMADLDEARIRESEPIVLLRSTAVRISAGSGGVTGELLHVQGGANGQLELETVPRSCFRR